MILKITEGSSISTVACLGWLLAVAARAWWEPAQGRAVLTPQPANTVSVMLQSPVLQATEMEVLWAMRTSMLVFGAAAAGLAFYSSSVYDLWFLSGELVYALLFPQLCCALFAPGTNAYGSAAGFLVGLLLRLLAGEPALSIPPAICYPACSLVNGTYSQLFPFKTFTVLVTLGTILAVSYVAVVLFRRNILPRRWDVCNITGGASTLIPLRQMKKQMGSPMVALEENRD